jgi:hypothetical protein
MSEDQLQMLSAQKLKSNFDGIWYATAVEGKGRKGRYCEKDVMVLANFAG